ncbi:hypothetical protein MA16_Dca002589 [Dendrobium catenatum]|uniref:Uncharacterized protein n=1 Tax=Dendrobium catenatum TaxID=906689 RepID=A0A2I0W0Y0_9ASPA|nr:hypothetical protein MA16_Dca002589 [Dendrobium catenatum]
MFRSVSEIEHGRDRVALQLNCGWLSTLAAHHIGWFMRQSNTKQRILVQKRSLLENEPNRPADSQFGWFIQPPDQTEYGRSSDVRNPYTVIRRATLTFGFQQPPSLSRMISHNLSLLAVFSAHSGINVEPPLNHPNIFAVWENVLDFGTENKTMNSRTMSIPGAQAISSTGSSYLSMPSLHFLKVSAFLNVLAWYYLIVS